MAVGETQQLDLKISKKQMSDIICIMFCDILNDISKRPKTGIGR